MPWHIESDNPGCEGFAVVKDEDGELEGCHRTEAQAKAQIAALYIAEADHVEEDRAESYPPTDAMVAEAERGLSWRDEYKRGGTDIGVARARDIINRRNLSIDTIARMRSYFARHEVDKTGTGWSPGEDGYPSAGRIAWALWGGDPGRSWADRIISQTRAGEGPDAIVVDIDGTLVGRGTVNRGLVADLNSTNAAKLVITGRLSTQRDATRQLLDRIGLDYEELYMNPGGDPDSYKAETARRLLRSYKIIYAVDNSPSARSAYQELGIDARDPGMSRQLEDEIDDLVDHADEMTNRQLVEQILAKIRR